MDFVGIICKNGMTHCLLNDYEIEKTEKGYQLSKVNDVKSIYNNDLKSITCIVGENGSGKTSLINEIYLSLFKNDNKSDYTFIIKSEDDNEQDYYITGKKRSVFWNEERISEYTGQNKKTKIVKFSATIESRSLEENINNYDISTTNLLYKYGIEKVTETDMLNQISFVVNNYNKLEEFNKSKGDKFIKIKDKLCIMALSNEGRGILGVKNRYLSKQIDFKMMKTNLNIGNSSNKNDLITVVFLKFMSLLLNKINILLPIDHYTEDGAINEHFVEDIKEELSDLASQGEFLEFDNKSIGLKVAYLNNLKEFINKELREFVNKYDKESRFCDEALTCLDKINDLKNIIKESSNLNFVLKDNDLLILTKIINEFINGNHIEKEVFSTITFGWQGVSSGEFALLNLFGRISSIETNLNKNNIIFLIDEVDIGLHPEWQRLWMHIVPYFFKMIMGENIQLIITTHSPIVLSDFTKNNVMLVGGQKIVEETFGQNIYTLMINGLFLENTIGEYSHLEINKIITKLRELSEDNSISDEVYKELENKITYIGDELVRNTLLKKLLSLKPVQYQEAGDYHAMSKEELINRIYLLERKI